MSGIKLTKEKRLRLRIHAQQIIEVQNKVPQWHWTKLQEHHYAIWMLEVLDELGRVEKILKRKAKMLRDLKSAGNRGSRTYACDYVGGVSALENLVSGCGL